VAVNIEMLFPVLPILPLIAAAVTARIVAGCVRRDYLLAVAPACAGLAAICVVVIALSLMHLLYQPTPGAGGPWGSTGITMTGLIIVLSVIYGVLGALLGLLIAGVVFIARGRRLRAGTATAGALRSSVKGDNDGPHG
jgi:hypothetical protein